IVSTVCDHCKDVLSRIQVHAIFSRRDIFIQKTAHFPKNKKKNARNTRFRRLLLEQLLFSLRIASVPLYTMVS
ncbi:hypothetical protein P4474_15115, partial [Geobacillus stearothermophilus]|uniref:hypothetical protein n=1 Tax=Geobacillus stearothermophilus TaxID=1422 RepID=UPI002E1A29A9|nr:hypothetical protein [Geobacillus stearothermophilus]